MFSAVFSLDAYREAYRRLNPNQKEAVDHIYGPLMVIAGPGTGKTQLLSVRICRILEQTDYGPENILCLTYTNAGVDAMRKRLESFIGIDARKIGIYTYHAFCNEIIQDHPEWFHVNELQPISDLEQYEWMEELVSQLSPEHELYRGTGNQFADVGNLLKLNKIIKQEGLTTDKVIKSIEEYLQQVEAGEVQEYVYKSNAKGYRKGELNKNKIEQLKQKLDRTRGALDIIDKYQQIVRERNRYDYDDMINWVIHLFKTQEWILQNYWEKYQFILVDEYQDTNGSQNQLLYLLTDYEQPNVMVVGDDDQAIYRFQGANIQNMQNFAQRFHHQNLKVVVLEENYRSTQDILDAANRLIENNQNRLISYLKDEFKLSKRLFAHA